jgi:hypothetical protein
MQGIGGPIAAAGIGGPLPMWAIVALLGMAAFCLICVCYLTWELWRDHR